MRKVLAGLIGLVMLVGFALPAGGLMGYINRQTIMIYDSVIAGDEVEIRALFDGQETEYHIVINTPGGRGVVTMSIINHIMDLKESGAKITTEVSGMAASAGAVIWLTGDVRIVHRHDILMFHKVRIIDKNTGEDIPRDQLDVGSKFVIDTLNEWMLQKITELIGEKKAKKIMKGETWMNGKDAFEMGLATILK